MKIELNFDNFHNLVRVMYNVDYVHIQDTLSNEEWGKFRSDPCGFLIRTDDTKAQAIWDAAMKRFDKDRTFTGAHAI